MRFLRADSVPWIARPNYVRELRHISLWGAFAGMVDGSFSSVVAAKTFGASPTLIAVVWATPNLAFLLSMFWGVLLRGRPRVRMFTTLALLAAIVTASIALTPATWHPWGGWIFAGQIALSRIFLSGLVNLRTGMWSANYPITHRAQVAAGIQTINGVHFLLVAATASLLFDREATLYRWVYPVTAIIGALSLIPLRRIRVRRERAEMRLIRARLHAEMGTRTDGRPRRSLLGGFQESMRILANDRPFARYCAAQNFLGSANFLVDPVLTVLFTQRLGLTYFQSSLLLDLLPMTMMIASTRWWARLFDRLGVLRFRVYNSAAWLVSVILVALGVGVMYIDWSSSMAVGLGLIIAGRITNGLGRGGGAIAWNLGHLYFAEKHNADLYMGIHVGLTGLRGITMPFIGNVVYHFAGGWSFVLAAMSAVGALVTFRRLAHDEARAA